MDHIWDVPGLFEMVLDHLAIISGLFIVSRASFCAWSGLWLYIGYLLPPGLLFVPGLDCGCILIIYCLQGFFLYLVWLCVGCLPHQGQASFVPGLNCGFCKRQTGHFRLLHVPIRLNIFLYEINLIGIFSYRLSGTTVSTSG